MGTLPSIGEVRSPWWADWDDQQWVVLLYIILIWWGDFFGVFGETSEMGGGSFNVVNLGFGGDMRCIVGIVLGPSRTRNTIFNGSKLIGQSWAETDTPFPM